MRTPNAQLSPASPLPRLQYQGCPGCLKDSTLWRGNKHSLDPTLGVCGQHALESQPRVWKSVLWMLRVGRRVVGEISWVSPQHLWGEMLRLGQHGDASPLTRPQILSRVQGCCSPLPKAPSSQGFLRTPTSRPWSSGG